MRLTYTAFNKRREPHQEPTMNIYTGLLFLHGHILRADDLVPPAPAPTDPARPGAQTPAPVAAPAQAATAVG